MKLEFKIVIKGYDFYTATEQKYTMEVKTDTDNKQNWEERLNRWIEMLKNMGIVPFDYRVLEYTKEYIAPYMRNGTPDTDYKLINELKMSNGSTVKIFVRKVGRKD